MVDDGETLCQSLVYLSKSFRLCQEGGLSC